MERNHPYTEGIVTHTVAVIAGTHQHDISVYAARTSSAYLVCRLGHMSMTFHDAATVCTVANAFAAVRAAAMGIPGTMPAATSPPEAQFAAQAFAITWTHPPSYQVVRHSRLDERIGRTRWWVDVHMGPVTWRVLDRAGLDAILDTMRAVHRTAVAVFLDGGKYRADPTKLPDAFDDLD